MNNVNKYLSCAVSLGEYPTKRRLQAHLKAFFDDIDLNGKNVLDVGGGSGLLSLYAAAQGAETVCIEPEADGSANGAQQKFKQLAACSGLQERAHLKICTLQDYTPDGMHDIVIMANTINHLNEDACIHLLNNQDARSKYVSIFKKVFEIMKPEGIIIITDCERRNFFNDLGATSPIVPSIEWHKHQHPRTWLGLLQESGFEHCRYDWMPPARLGRFGKLLFGNRVSAYTLTGMFRLTASKPK